MIGESQVRNLIGSTAYDQSGEKIGRVGQVYYGVNEVDRGWYLSAPCVR